MTSYAIFAGLFLMILSSAACIRQEASQALEVPALIVKDEDAQIKAAQELINQMPDSAAGYNRLAIAYIRRARETGDFTLNTKAEESVNRALELDQDDFEANKIRASLLLTLHRFEEALKFGRKLQQEYPQDAFFYGVLTDAHIELGNYPLAIENVQKMVDLRPDTASYSRVSAVRSMHGDSMGAIEAMTKAAQMADPQDAEARAWCLVRLGEEFFKVGKYMQAEDQFDTALEIFPDYHLALAGKGKMRAVAGEYENAIKFYSGALSRSPLTRTYIELGNVYLKTGDTAGAERQYELAATATGNSHGEADPRLISLLRADRGKQIGEALKIARHEFGHHKDIFTADVYAWCLYKNGDIKKAREVISRALRLETEDARIFYHAGMIEKDLGNKKAAADLLQKAIDTNPVFDLLQAPEAEKALAELKRGQG